jgi:hypothetical protein
MVVLLGVMARVVAAMVALDERDAPVPHVASLSRSI